MPTLFSLKDVLVHFQKFQAVYEFPARASYRSTRVYQHHSRTAARQLRNTDGGYGGLTRVTPCKRVSRAAKASRAQHRPLSCGNIVLPTTCWKSYPPGSLLPQNTRLWNATTPASARLLCAPALKNTFPESTCKRWPKSRRYACKFADSTARQTGGRTRCRDSGTKRDSLRPQDLFAPTKIRLQCT